MEKDDLFFKVSIKQNGGIHDNFYYWDSGDSIDYSNKLSIKLSMGGFQNSMISFQIVGNIFKIAVAVVVQANGRIRDIVILTCPSQGGWGDRFPYHRQYVIFPQDIIQVVCTPHPQ